MKILHIISQSPDFTGSGKFIRQIIRQSSRQGHDNFLVAGVQADFVMPSTLIHDDNCLFVRFDGQDFDYPIPGMSDIMPYKSTVFSTLSGSRLSAYQSVFEKKIMKAVNKFKPDLIHSHHLWLVSAIARKAAPTIPMVTTCHGTCLRQHHLAAHIGEPLKRELRHIDRIIALSQDQKEKIQTILGGLPENIRIISGGFNKDCFFPGPKSFGGTVDLLYAGKLASAKGVPWLLKSLKRIEEMPFRLHIAGDASPEQKSLCLTLAEKLGDKVIYHGALSHDALGNLMRKSHVFVLPSFYEGLPLVLMEALACGCRIVATALPGVHEIFNVPHPQMVTLVDLPPLETIDAPWKKDENMLEERLSKVLAKMIDLVQEAPMPDMDYVKMASAGFAWETIFKKIETVYFETLSQTRG